ncbi:NAD(P)/FAD-dependent oxidoreductase [Streptomyces sp. NPDC055078]
MTAAMAGTADAVVVGAGVIGASIAHQLARAGRKVIVVDKAGGAGDGSTSASSAVVRFTFSTWAGVAVAWESCHHWANWRDHLRAEPDEDLAVYRRTGLVQLDADTYPRSVFLPHFDRVGVPYEEWDPDTLRRRVPGIDAGRYGPPKRLDDDAFWADPAGSLGGVHTPDAGFVNDPRLAAANLAAAARRAGASVLLRRTVTSVLTRGGRVTGVLLDGSERIDAPIVVNAAGPWSRRLNELAGAGEDFAVGVRPLRQEVHHVAAPPGYGTPHSPGIAVADIDLGIYVRPESGGAMLVGGIEPPCDPLEWVDNPDEIDANPTKPVFEAQVTRAARRFGELGVPHRPRGVAGVYDVSDDWSPIYDRTGVEGFYVAIGTSGNQFKNAPLVGAVLSTIIEHVERGADHDTTPARLTAPYSGLTIDLGAFSRRRTVDPLAGGSVMG